MGGEGTEGEKEEGAMYLASSRSWIGGFSEESVHLGIKKMGPSQKAG